MGCEVMVSFVNGKPMGGKVERLFANSTAIISHGSGYEKQIVSLIVVSKSVRVFMI